MAASAQATAEIERSAAKIGAINTRMTVILHCNARYAELYQFRAQLHHLPTGSKDAIDHKAKMVDAYFRQYWGLKSDQIDYWIANFVDSETLSSWLLSTVDALADHSEVEGESYRESWERVAPEHRHVNQTLAKIVDHIMSNIAKRDAPLMRFAKLYKLLCEAEKSVEGIRGQLASNEMTFETLLTTYKSDTRNAIESLQFGHR
jgi:hypothetical protein